MLTMWTKHLKTEEERTNFRNSVFGSRYILNRAVQILDEEKDAQEKALLSPTIYDQPNWDYRQAHSNGFAAGLQFAKRLLTVDQTESNK